MKKTTISFWVTFCTLLLLGILLILNAQSQRAKYVAAYRQGMNAGYAMAFCPTDVANRATLDWIIEHTPENIIHCSDLKKKE